MNIVMINPVHPATPHVSGLRAWRFACELAALGHRVVLLTGSPAADQDVLPDLIATHDWTRPFVIACKAPASMASSHSGLPRHLRKAVTAWRMILRGGTHGGWIEAAVLAASRLESFKPDVVWCTFGMMEAVLAARRIAAHAGCPWVLDLKDNWELYVPRRLRRLMAWRTRGWSALTANAKFTARKAGIWQNGSAAVVYSGVDDAFFGDGVGAVPFDPICYINLVGSVYFADRLESFLAGVETWLSSLVPDQRSTIAIRYLGGDTSLVADAGQRCVPRLGIELAGYVPLERMATLCREAVVNAYIAHPGTFHHKLLELLACERPVMACPAESDESRDLARQASGVLLEAADATEVCKGLAKAYEMWSAGHRRSAAVHAVRQYSWPQQARGLERVLAGVVSSFRNAAVQ